MKKAAKANPFAKKGKGKKGEPPEGEEMPKKAAEKAKSVKPGMKPPFFMKGKPKTKGKKK
jgi:hypothetical protein